MMSYHSDFVINTLPGLDPDTICDYLNDLNQYDFLEVAGCGVVQSIDKVFWIDFPEDMSCLSEIFPEILFIVDRSGEETGDIERCYFKRGMMQCSDATISFEDFDESKLEVV
jgi:hypothetical protein